MAIHNDNNNKDSNNNKDEDSNNNTNNNNDIKIVLLIKNLTSIYRPVKSINCPTKAPVRSELLLY